MNKKKKKMNIQVTRNVSRAAALIPLTELSYALGIILCFCQNNTSALVLMQSLLMAIQALALTSMSHG